MPHIDEVVRKIDANFKEIDKSNDGKISYQEFQDLRLPGLSEKQAEAMFQQIVLNKDDQAGPETEITKDDLANHKFDLREEVFRSAVDRLSKIFGQEVTELGFRDFNGVPSYRIKAGKDMADADAVIDKLIPIRTDAGLTKAEFPFRADKEGNVVIYGGAIIDFRKATPQLKTEVCEALEKPAVQKAIQKSFDR